VPVAVPHVAADARIFHAGVKPGAGVEAALAAFSWEDGIGGVLLWPPKRLDSLDRVRVQMDRASRSVLRLRKFDGPAIQMNLRPCAGVLLAKAHPGVDTHHKLGQVLRKALGDDLVQCVILFATQEAQAACAFFPLAHKPGGIDGHFAVADTLPIAKGDERFIAVLLGGVVERYRPSVQTRRLAPLSDITETDCKTVETAMTKCSTWLPGHDKAPAARAPVPGAAELKKDIEAAEAWVKTIRDCRK